MQKEQAGAGAEATGEAAVEAERQGAEHAAQDAADSVLVSRSLTRGGGERQAQYPLTISTTTTAGSTL